jgi:hypothetical protein
VKFARDVRTLILVAALISALASAGGCRQSDNSPPPKADDPRRDVNERKEADAKEAENAAAAKAEKAAQEAQANAIASGQAWLTQTGKSQMTDATWSVVYRYSVNTISFEFPYEGEQRAELQLVLDKGHIGRVSLLIERGQFDCQDSCSVEVRFDDQPAYAPWFRDTQDRIPSLNLGRWPIDHTKRFIADLLKSHRLRIQPRFYHQDAPVIEFYLDGLSEALATSTAATSAQRPVTPK